MLLFPPLQLFMCLLWCLLQLVVMFMYWDLPPREKGRGQDGSTIHSKDAEDEKRLMEDDDDEEKPLIASPELTGSYGSVVTSSSSIHHAPMASNATTNHVSAASPVLPDKSSRLNKKKSFCFSRGEWLAVNEAPAKLFFFIIFIFSPLSRIWIMALFQFDTWNKSSGNNQACQVNLFICNGLSEIVAPWPGRGLDSDPRPSCVEFACSHWACMGSLLVLPFPPTVQRHAREVNWQLWIVCRCTCECGVFVSLCWRLVHGGPAFALR